MRDIGNVYKRDGVYYIAISPYTLLTFRQGKFAQYTSDDKHTFVKDMSVRRLCKKWKIPISRLDEETKKYFAPDAEAQERALLEPIKDLKDLDLSWS